MIYIIMNLNNYFLVLKKNKDFFFKIILTYLFSIYFFYYITLKLFIFNISISVLLPSNENEKSRIKQWNCQKFSLKRMLTISKYYYIRYRSININSEKTIKDRGERSIRKRSGWCFPRSKPANKALGATSRFYGKQVYLAWQNSRPTLCNKQARWPSAVADLLVAYVSKLRKKQWCSIDSETLTLRIALNQWHQKPVFSISIHEIKDLWFCFTFYFFIFHSCKSSFFFFFNCWCQTSKNWMRNLCHTWCQSRDKL